MAKEIKFNTNSSQAKVKVHNNTDQFKVGKVEVSDMYTGEYELTPSDTKQVLPTANKIMSNNVVINPIPSNYGLIEWNGSYLKIS